MNIHPKNKSDVGKRLAIAALKVAYNKNIVSTGPIYKSVAIQGDTAIINFSESGGELITKDKYGYVRGFAMAGVDKKFHWAKAYIKDDKVIVYCNAVSKPVAVRYAWSDNPGATDLYNTIGLPAIPFRTDNWPLKTMDKVFSENPWE